MMTDGIFSQTPDEPAGGYWQISFPPTPRFEPDRPTGSVNLSRVQWIDLSYQPAGEFPIDNPAVNIELFYGDGTVRKRTYDGPKIRIEEADTVDLREMLIDCPSLKRKNTAPDDTSLSSATAAPSNANVESS